MHDDSCNQRLAQAGGQADQCILQQGGLDYVHLVRSLVDSCWVYPVLGTLPIAAELDCVKGKICLHGIYPHEEGMRDVRMHEEGEERMREVMSCRAQH